MVCNRDRIIYSRLFFTRKRAINHRMIAVKLQYICIAACHGHMLVIAVRHDAVVFKNRRSRHLQITRNLCKVNRLRFVDKISDKPRIFINQSFFHRSFFFFGALFNCDIKEFKAFCRFCCRTLRCHFLHSIAFVVRSRVVGFRRSLQNTGCRTVAVVFRINILRVFRLNRCP